VRDAVEALRAARVARDEGQLAIGGAVRAPAQEVLRREGLAVLVDAEERRVEAVARVLEVVFVAAVELRLRLGRDTGGCPRSAVLVEVLPVRRRPQCIPLAAGLVRICVYARHLQRGIDQAARTLGRR
jgi:hypothetical protein